MSYKVIICLVVVQLRMTFADGDQAICETIKDLDGFCPSGKTYDPSNANTKCKMSECSKDEFADVSKCCTNKATCKTTEHFPGGFCPSGQVYNPLNANVNCKSLECSQGEYADVSKCCTADTDTESSDTKLSDTVVNAIIGGSVAVAAAIIGLISSVLGICLNKKKVDKEEPEKEEPEQEYTGFVDGSVFHIVHAGCNLGISDYKDGEGDGLCFAYKPRDSAYIRDGKERFRAIHESGGWFRLRSAKTDHNFTVSINQDGDGDSQTFAGPARGYTQDDKALFKSKPHPSGHGFTLRCKHYGEGKLMFVSKHEDGDGDRRVFFGPSRSHTHSCDIFEIKPYKIPV